MSGAKSPGLAMWKLHHCYLLWDCLAYISIAHISHTGVVWSRRGIISMSMMHAKNLSLISQHNTPYLSLGNCLTDISLRKPIASQVADRKESIMYCYLLLGCLIIPSPPQYGTSSLSSYACYGLALDRIGWWSVIILFSCCWVQPTFSGPIFGPWKKLLAEHVFFKSRLLQKHSKVLRR